MYTPKAYVEADRQVLFDSMRAWSFATLVTAVDGVANATHLPFLLDVDDAGNALLTTHFARANAQLKDIQAGATALVIVQGPHAFISPSWYTNQLTFPTWNYTAVHAHGRPELVEDTAAVRAVLDRTVALYDTPLGGDWRFPEMPAELTASRLRAIVALRIPVVELEGKFKLNQDKSVDDRLGVIAALERLGETSGVAVARLMREHPDLAS